MAGRRKARYDQTVRDEPISEGQRVYLRNLGVRGRSKMQDTWGSEVYEVLKAPKGGPVYTIAPLDEKGKVKNVHRNHLKLCPATLAMAPPRREPTTSRILPDEDHSDDDLCLRMEEGRPQAQALVSHLPAILQQPGTPPADIPSSLHLPQQETEDHSQPPSDDAIAPGDCGPPPGQIPLRRTTRATAGRHSNPHNLPEALGNGVRGAMNSRIPVSNHVVSVHFRPWESDSIAVTTMQSPGVDVTGRESR